MPKPFNWTPKRDEQLRAWATAVPPVSITEQAKRLKTSRTTVARRRAALGIESDRTQTAAANEARRVDAKARRTAIAEGLLDDAEKLRAQLFAPTVAFNFGGKDNTYEEHHLDEPTFTDKLKIVQAVGVAVDRHIKLVEHDSDTGISEATSMLEQLFTELERTRPKT